MVKHTVARLRTIRDSPEWLDQKRRCRAWYDQNTDLAKERARAHAVANPVARSIVEQNYRDRALLARGVR